MILKNLKYCEEGDSENSFKRMGGKRRQVLA